MSNPFPESSRKSPPLLQRIIVSFLIAAVAAAMHYSGVRRAESLSDFSILWSGSTVLAHGGNPYAEIGPGRTIDLPSPVFYPAPALVAAMPFTLLPSPIAGTVFIFVSSLLLGIGVTRYGWHLLPIFPSVAFMTNARLGQVSALMCAILFIPALAFVSIAKPQASLPILASTRRSPAWIWAIIGGIFLTTGAFILAPRWPTYWLDQLAHADYFRPPLLTVGGIFISLVLLRWRRPEAWLVFIAACLPQTWYPYNGLILLTVAATYREAALLSLVSSIGWLITYAWLIDEWRSTETRNVMQTVLVALGYLPAVLLILRRKNEGPEPLWLQWILERLGYRRQPSATSTNIVS